MKKIFFNPYDDLIAPYLGFDYKDCFIFADVFLSELFTIMLGYRE